MVSVKDTTFIVLSQCLKTEIFLNPHQLCVVNGTLIIASVEVAVAVFWPEWLKSVLS